jgi:hypothetical protein
VANTWFKSQHCSLTHTHSLSPDAAQPPTHPPRAPTTLAAAPPSLSLSLSLVKHELNASKDAKAIRKGTQRRPSSATFAQNFATFAFKFNDSLRLKFVLTQAHQVLGCRSSAARTSVAKPSLLWRELRSLINACYQGSRLLDSHFVAVVSLVLGPAFFTYLSNQLIRSASTSSKVSRAAYPCASYGSVT